MNEGAAGPGSFARIVLMLDGRDCGSGTAVTDWVEVILEAMLTEVEPGCGGAMSEGDAIDALYGMKLDRIYIWIWILYI